jgi:putative transposase
MKRDIKIHTIRMKLLEGYKDKQIRDELGISKRTYFRWKKKITNHDAASILNKQKPGPKPTMNINPIDSRRIQIWRRSYGWGPTKIEGHLNVHYGNHIPHNRIYKLFKEKGLNRPIGKPRKTWGKKRWERAHSMSLWQGDWKDINTQFGPMMTFYDDHSRYVVASKRFVEATTENSIRLLESAFKKYGCPEQILTDHGTQFTNNRGEEPSSFETFCKDNGVQVIHSTVKRPTTCGKIENFHGRYDAEIWVTKGNHAKFVRYWNNKRPCGAIGYLYPAEVFYRDRKSAINSG